MPTVFSELFTRALTTVVKKCFVRLIADYIKASLTPIFDPHLFAYKTKTKKEDHITMALHSALGRVRAPGNHAHAVNYNSAFFNII